MKYNLYQIISHGQCVGRTSRGRRCALPANRLFCRHHKNQARWFTLSVFGTLVIITGLICGLYADFANPMLRTIHDRNIKSHLSDIGSSDFLINYTISQQKFERPLLSIKLSNNAKSIIDSNVEGLYWIDIQLTHNGEPTGAASLESQSFLSSSFTNPTTGALSHETIANSLSLAAVIWDPKDNYYQIGPYDISFNYNAKLLAAYKEYSEHMPSWINNNGYNSDQDRSSWKFSPLVIIQPAVTSVHYGQTANSLKNVYPIINRPAIGDFSSLGQHGYELNYDEITSIRKSDLYVQLEYIDGTFSDVRLVNKVDGDIPK